MVWAHSNIKNKNNNQPTSLKNITTKHDNNINSNDNNNNSNNNNNNNYNNNSTNTTTVAVLAQGSKPGLGEPWASPRVPQRSSAAS